MDTPRELHLLRGLCGSHRGETTALSDRFSDPVRRQDQLPQGNDRANARHPPHCRALACRTKGMDRRSAPSVGSCPTYRACEAAIHKSSSAARLVGDHFSHSQRPLLVLGSSNRVPSCKTSCIVAWKSDTSYKPEAALHCMTQMPTGKPTKGWWRRPEASPSPSCTVMHIRVRTPYVARRQVCTRQKQTERRPEARGTSGGSARVRHRVPGAVGRARVPQKILSRRHPFPVAERVNEGLRRVRGCHGRGPLCLLRLLGRGAHQLHPHPLVHSPANSSQ